MSKYYFLKVKEIEKETEEASTLHFWHPLNEVVAYRPGQFLTLLLPVDDKKIRRSYSMSSSPYTDVSLAITIKRVPGGYASNLLLDSVKVGDTLEVMEPMGAFFPKQSDDQTRQVVFIGAGSGVTPLFSILKSILMVEPESEVFLIYGSRSEESIIFKKKIDALEAKYGARFKVVHTLSQPSESWEGEKGRLNKSHLLKIVEKLPTLNKSEAEFFLCGPEDMMEEAHRALAILAVPENKIRKESFMTATAAQPGEVTLEEEDDTLKTREITLFYEGAEYKLPVKPHETILEAALNMDIDLPYSCQAGMCTACLGRCTSGKVHLDEEDALSEAELNEGFILTCVSHPMSDDVIIEVE
ncbi:ferredoxin--NADP reductase [Dyadobacter fanqingshengii]|uniref:Ferredoxin--NADP reductase n=1 Tax=Dyadobacter fanqingshengii TaxID=2906443 RepID=A0A9X1TI66_9BACT|nr:ferredoxin--NADP reductase [Dyadobacter fanqingshengii]MCF0042502.1 ferredoxin--NADP reductase [Dyadobacter fanqingshengii]USJ34975.1 ferredoxin--NADP reductase [Dyadobacter fanqingshengii]